MNAAATTWDSAMLVVSRGVILGIALYALHVTTGLLRDQPSPQERAVPRPIVIFTMSWLVVLVLIVTYLLVTASQAVVQQWLRTAYAMALVWPTAGLAWIIALGRRALKRTYLKVLDPTTGEVKLIEVRQEETTAR